MSKISQYVTEMVHEMWTGCVHKTAWNVPHGGADTNLSFIITCEISRV